MDVHEAIRQAEAILPGKAAPEGEEDARWQAIIAIGDYTETDPEAVWSFVERWGCHENEDLRTAVATCLLEHLLEAHFESLFPRVERATRSNRVFADTLSMCWKLGQAATPENAEKINRLLEETAR